MRQIIKFERSNNGGISIAKEIKFEPVTSLPKNQPLMYEWTDGKYCEVGSKETIQGWMDKTSFAVRDVISREVLMHNWTRGSIYTDSLLTNPFHHVSFSPCKKIAESSNVVKVSTSGFYIPMQKVDPLFTYVSYLDNFTPKWIRRDLSSLSVEDYAYSELEREQNEIKESVPVYDSLLWMNKKMDLYDLYDDILDCRWLPTNSFEPTEPTGIEFSFYGPGEGGNHYEIVLQTSSDKLLYQNRIVNKADTIEVKAEEFKARFIINSYKISRNILEDLIIHYTLWIYGSKRGTWD
jgi:hypothetical protein